MGQYQKSFLIGLQIADILALCQIGLMSQNELIANSISIFCWGIIGMVFVLTSLVFNNTDWSITKMTLTHAITSYIPLLPIAFFLNWIDFNGNQITKFSIIYVLIYIITWSFFMFKAKREIDLLNSKLH